VRHRAPEIGSKTEAAHDKASLTSEPEFLESRFPLWGSGRSQQPGKEEQPEPR